MRPDLVSMSDDPIAAAGDAIGRKMSELLARAAAAEAALAKNQEAAWDAVAEKNTEIERLRAELSQERETCARQDMAISMMEADAEAMEAALKTLALAASKFRAASDHSLGWTDEHPHIKPFVAAMLKARAALARIGGGDE